MDDLKTERSFDLQATSAIDVLNLFFIHGCFTQHIQAMADVRSTGTGSKCLYCSSKVDDTILMILMVLMHTDVRLL